LFLATASSERKCERILLGLFLTLMVHVSASPRKVSLYDRPPTRSGNGTSAESAAEPAATLPSKAGMPFRITTDICEMQYRNKKSLQNRHL
jgi:hypothetical protein